MADFPKQWIKLGTRRNISHMEIIESYFKGSSDKKTHYMQMFMPVFNLVDSMTAVQKYFEVGKLARSFRSFPYWYGWHWVKSVQIRSFFWSVLSRTWAEYGQEKTPYLDTFHVVWF